MRRTKRVCLYPLWLRLWHWSNALLFLSLVVTGFRLHFVELPMAVMPFETAVMVHNTAGILIIALYGVYLTGNALSGNFRHYRPRFRGLVSGLLIQMKFYSGGIFRGEREPFPPTEESKFNPLQQLTYLFVAYAGLPVLMGTGIAYMFPEYFSHEFLGMVGILPVAIGHYVIGILLSLFLIGHIYLATAGETPTSEFSKMTSGWIDVEVDERGSSDRA